MEEQDTDKTQDQDKEEVKINITYEDHEVVEYIDGYQKIWKYEG